MEVGPKSIDPLPHSRAQIAIRLKDALSAILFELRQHAMSGLNQSLLARNASPQLQKGRAFVLEGVRQNAVFDLIQLSGDLLRSLADRIRGGHEKALKQRRAILEGSALLRLVFNRHRGARCVVARRQEKLRP
jgi:hypothetical protein